MADVYDTAEMGRFDRWVDRLRGPNSAGFRDAIVDVLDTAEGVKLWFEDRGLKPSAADVVAMTALVMTRETEMARRQQLAEGAESMMEEAARASAEAMDEDGRE